MDVGSSCNFIRARNDVGWIVTRKHEEKGGSPRKTFVHRALKLTHKYGHSYLYINIWALVLQPRFFLNFRRVRNIHIVLYLAVSYSVESSLNGKRIRAITLLTESWHKREKNFIEKVRKFATNTCTKNHENLKTLRNTFRFFHELTSPRKCLVGCREDEKIIRQERMKLSLD